MAFNRNAIAQTGVLPSNTRLIQDTMPLQIREMKNVVSEASGGKKPVLRITGVFQKADVKNENGRIYPKNILREAVEHLSNELPNRSIVGEYDHPCIASSDFRVLTPDGWKDFVDIKPGDKVYSRVDGEMVESIVKDIVDEPFAGTIYRFKGRHIDVGLTGNHKVIMDTRSDYPISQIESKVTDIISDRKKYNKCMIPRIARWNGKEQQYYVVPGISQSELKCSINRYNNDVTKDLYIDSRIFVAFLGLWLAEGNLCSNYGIFINQKKPDYKPDIEEMLKLFPEQLKWTRHENGYYLADARLHKWLKPLGNRYTKYIPNDIKQLDPMLLDELVYWFKVGDGRMKHGRNNVFSVSKKLIDDLHECHIKSGGCCYETTIEPKNDYEFSGHTITATKKKVLHQLTLSHTKGIYMDDRFLQIIPEEYEGNVYCLITEHGNFYMQHNGCSFWTGNSDAKIHLDRISHLITKVWMESNYVYGEAEVLEGTDCGRNLAALLRAGVQVGISSRGVGDMEVVNEGMEDEHFVVQDGYRFVTWDVVSEPSVQEATLSVMESKNRRNRARNGRKIVTRADLKPEIKLLHALREEFNF